MRCMRLLTGERAGYYADFGSLADLAKALREVFVYDGRYSRYRDRIHGRPVVDLPGIALPGLRAKPRPGGQSR